MKHIPYSIYSVQKHYNDGFGFEDKCYLPAWSLHRLILLCPNTGVLTITKGAVEYEGLINYQVEEEDGFFSKQGDDIYGNLLDCIEWLIKKGYFPKEHLF